MTLRRFLSGSPIKLLEVGLLQAPAKQLCPDCGSAMECLMVTFVVGNSGEPWSLPFPCWFTCAPGKDSVEPVEIESVASVETATGKANRSAEPQRGFRKQRSRHNARKAA